MNRNLTALILIIIAVGIYFTVTEGLLTEARAVNTVNIKYISALKSADKLIDLRNSLLNDYNNLSQNDRDRLDKIVPKSVDNIRLIIDLNSVALQHGFSLKNVKATASTEDSSSTGRQAQAFSPAAMQATPDGSMNPMINVGGTATAIATPSLDNVTVSFSVSAPYQQFIAFLMDLESNLRIMDVTHISVTGNDTGIYDWSIELKTYWLRAQ